MDSPEIPAAAGAPRSRTLQLQGPRPSPLSLNKQSRTIAKPARQPPERLEPMIIYDVSPEPICVDASDFKSVVQRLTGLGSAPAASAGATSPAAMEKEREREDLNDGFELMNLGQTPGIISPASANLPDLPAGVLSPADFAGIQENPMSTFGSCFFPSPNSLSSSSSSHTFTGGFDFSQNPSPVFDFSTIFDS